MSGGRPRRRAKRSAALAATPADDGSAPVLPEYGRGTIGDLLPALGRRLGVPPSPTLETEGDETAGGKADLDLPSSDRYVVLLVDGLGWHLARRNVASTPYLGMLLRDAVRLSAGVPSTTATSLASLGTGLPPGGHGLVGYTSRVPQTGEILNALTWESDLVPRAYQSKPTYFEWAAAHGVTVSSVALERFRGTGLTEAALRGPEFVPFSDERATEQRIELVVEAALRGSRSIVYAYERELDHIGHASGCSSLAWQAQLIRVDRLCARLREALPESVKLLVTADHGMVDVPAEHRTVAEDDPFLMAGVSALAGEGRFRQLYVDHEPAASVAARWSDQLGALAWVRTRDEAIEEGWFGPVDEELRERYGHVLVAMRGDHAVMTRQFPREFSLIGMHGSLTSEEMLIPLFVD